MPTPTPPAFIDKSPLLREDQDFRFLRERGLQYLRKLGSSHWTDHNLHDPGVTILEMLAYVMTDAGLRTDMPLEDILAESHPLDPLDDNGAEKPFFTAAQVLPCHPVTLNDFRKIIMDVPGVKNAWLELVEEPEPPLYLDCGRKILSYEKDDGKGNAFDPVRIQGLYDVLLELESDQELGELNRIRYAFELNVLGEKGEVVLYFPPAWGRFIPAGRRPADFTLYHLDQLVSFPETSYYAGLLVLGVPGAENEKLPLEFHLQSPFRKNAAFLRHLDKALQARLSDLVAYLGRRVDKGLEVAGRVRSRLEANRSLGEDFLRIHPIPMDEIGVCADIELHPEAFPEKIAAEIQYALSGLLNPPVHFYSMQELLDLGVPVEEVFSGPRLDHGFLLEGEMESAALREEVRVSDLIHAVMDIPGVTGVRNILATDFSLGMPRGEAQEWSLAIGKGRALRFSMEKSKLVFYKGHIPYQARKSLVLESLRDLQARDRQARLAPGLRDIPLPKGKSRDLGGFRTLQRDFPSVYGIGQDGRPSETPQRTAQAKQLKAFLLLFERVLADQQAQLARVGDLFSLKPEIRATYFSQPLHPLPVTYRFTEKARARLQAKGTPPSVAARLDPLLNEASGDAEAFTLQARALMGALDFLAYRGDLLEACAVPGWQGASVPRIFNLEKEFVDAVEKEISEAAPGAGRTSPDWDRYESIEAEWKRFLLGRKLEWERNFRARDPLLEDRSVFEDRRNRFLDHLLARYGEQFSDYVLMASELEESKAPERLIEDKLDFLRDFPELGYERGKAFNQADAGGIWDTRNVSGLEKRVARLTGMARYDRRSLADRGLDEFIIEPAKNKTAKKEFHFKLPGEGTSEILSASTQYPDKQAALQEIDSVIRYGRQAANYRIKKDKRGKWHVTLVDEEGEIIARRIEYFPSHKAAEAAREEAARRVGEIYDSCEGFHLVEHLLLRPRKAGDRLFRVCAEGGCGCCPGESDPFSFRISLVLPAWTHRFRRMDFRKFFEDTVRKEAPAHMHVKICWVGREDMGRFEAAYKEWLGRSEGTPSSESDASASRSRLMEILESLRSVYPETRLHDCENEGGDKVLLNLSRLGTAQGDPDDDL
jgi:uncharacterized protein YegP (UPF0339 family)